jgi:hypothetical protein
VKIPFGKFKGQDLADLPDDYLDWLLTIELREPLHSGIAREAYARMRAPREQTGLRTLDTNKIQKVYRSLAFVYHPDRMGGNGDVMKGINLFYEAIRQ